MRESLGARRLMAVMMVGALAGAACLGTTDDAADEAVDPESANAGPAGQEAAEGGALTSAAQSDERREPQAPRAEGDRLADLLTSEDYLLLDVRRPDELEERGTVEGYLNIPIEQLAERLDEVPRDRPILTA